MAKLVGHLDCDAFYVSAERVRFPWLTGKPVGVLGNQGACVIAKSYEMKKAGVKTGTPIWEAQRMCPDGIYVKRDFRWYEVLSRMILGIVRDHSPRVEFYSVDEFFFVVDEKNPLAFAQSLQQFILAEVGVPVTIGFARTRTLAKLVSDTAKPFGCKVMTDPQDITELLGRLQVNEITGIAKRRAATLNAHGILTCLDFVRTDRRKILQLITKTGEGLWYELNGDPVVPINTERTPHKMLSRGGSLAGKVRSFEFLEAWLVRNVERLIEELHWYEVEACTLSVFVCYDDDRPALGDGRSLGGSTDRFDTLLESAKVSLRAAWMPGWTATHMHLIAGDLRRRGCRQRGLFEGPAEPVRTVDRLKVQVNEAIGRWKLRSGATLPLKEIYSDDTHTYDVYDIKGKTCF